MITVLPDGLCHAHGPYEDEMQCPKWPSCADAEPVPFYVEAGKWFTSYEQKLSEAKDKVVREAQRLVLTGGVNREPITWAVVELANLEATNRMYEKLAGWRHE